DATAAGLGRDGNAYMKMIGGVADDWERLEESGVGPLCGPEQPFALGRFGLLALRSAEGLAKSAFRQERTRALFGGIAAHGLLPLDHTLTAGFGLTLGAMCHVPGWLIPKGGAQKITDALVAELQSLGGEGVPGPRVPSIAALPPAKAILGDVSPSPLLRLAGHKFPASYRQQL